MTGYADLRPDQWALIGDLHDRVGDIEAGCPPFVIPIGSAGGSEDEFQNGWDHAGAPYEDWGYRICDGALEFKGHLDGGSSGTVAFTLPAEYLIFPGDLSFLTDVGAPSAFVVGRVHVDMTTGDITITFPA